MNIPVVEVERSGAAGPPPGEEDPGGRARSVLRPLERDRTVDRGLVHRLCVAEVFVTDHQPVGPDGYQVAVQLPRSHSYYGDHREQPDALDPLLLLECCRQAETLGAHEYFGVPRDARFVLSAWRLSVGPRPADGPRPGPVSLTITVSTANQHRRTGRLQRQEYSMAITSGDDLIGQAWMDVAYLGPALYRKMRTPAGGRAPDLSDPGHAQSGSLLSPYRIARRDPANVLLLDVTADSGRGTATLRVPVANPSMFDHPLDHVPGMVLTEAARQLALLAGFDRTPQLSTARLTGLKARFERHTELDTPCELRAHHRERPADRFGRPAPAPGDVEVEAWQEGQITARFIITHSTGEDS